MYGLFYISFILLKCSHLTRSESTHWAHDYLATKTTYTTHPKTSSHDPMLWELEQATHGDYEPLHVDALYRHGTRYPGKEKLAIWTKTLEKLKQFDSKRLLNETTKSWRRLFPHARNYTLHEKGWYEMQGLAKQLFEMTEQLFHKILTYKDHNTDASFVIFSSPKARVVASAMAYVTKLKCLLLELPANDMKVCSRFQPRRVVLKSQFSDGETVNYGGFHIFMNRNKLRSFDDCDKYTNSVENNATADFQYKQFVYSPVMNQVRMEVSKHFNTTLTVKDVLALYQTCSFMLSLHGKDSICNLFEEKHFKILEYAADLKHYYKTGYGYHINYRLSCRLLIDVVSRLDEIRSSIGKKKASIVLRFGHAETLIPLLCLLGLYKDEVALTAENYPLHGNGRVFRTGTFSPFAGNILFVLYKAKKNISPALKLGIVINSCLIKLPFSGGCYLCDYDKVRPLLLSFVDKFSCDTVCHLTSTREEL